MHKGIGRAAYAASIAVAAMLAVAGPLTAQKTVADTVVADTSVHGAPVVFRGDTLFSLYATFGAFTPAERAAGVSDRLGREYAAGWKWPDSVAVINGSSHSELVIGKTVLMSVLDSDAVRAGRPRAQLATEDARIVSRALAAAVARGSARTLWLGALFALLATIVLALALKVIGVVVPRVIGAINHARHSRIPALGIQRFEIVSSSRIADILIGLVTALRTALVIILLYFYVPLVLSFFPWTAPLATRIIGYVIAPLRSVGVAVAGYLPNLFVIGVIIFVTRYALKVIHLFFDAITQGAVVLPNFERDWGQPTYKIVRFLVFAFVVVIILPYLPGSGSDAFKGVSLFLGALFTLGSSSAIANIVAGTVLTYTKAFQVGDRIQIGETSGDVIERTLLVTRVRTIKNVDITIPNAQVLSSHITNFSTVAQTGGVILHTTVTIGYDAPWRTVHELLIAAARATEGILQTPAPFVLQTSLDDFFVSYQINAYTDVPAQMAETYSGLHMNIQEQFNTAGVEIMSPHYAALRDGNTTAIPPDALPRGYHAPGFRVSGDARP